MGSDLNESAAMVSQISQGVAIEYTAFREEAQEPQGAEEPA